MPPHVPPSNDGWENVSANHPPSVVHYPTMSFPLRPPLLQLSQHVSYVPSHVHLFHLPKNYKYLGIEPQQSKVKWTTIFVSSNSLDTYAYTIKSLPSDLVDDVIKMTFYDMHPNISRVENKIGLFIFT